MICDQLDSRHETLRGQPWDRAFEFLAGLDADAEEGRYPLDGEAMYAVVDSYETRTVESAHPEAHREYIDIQCVLAGHEQIAWWSTPGLQVQTPYDPAKDIAFYDRPDNAGTMIDMVPGRFAVFFPGDAHMPCLQAGTGPAPVKKVVIKIRRQET
jgi:YhcH/YjgK/YiaL family protein